MAVVSTFTTYLAGSTYCQDGIRGSYEGEPVMLEREPDNPHDANAIAVKAASGLIGYVSRREASTLAVAIDNGDKVQGRVGEIFEGRGGLVVCLSVTLTPKSLL